MYTAEELVWATQLAYCNFDEDDVDFSVQSTLRDEGYYIYYNYDEKTAKTATGDEATMIQETKAFIDAVARGDKCKNWKIVDVKNDESDSGLYAVVIETAEDEVNSTERMCHA